MLEVVHNVPLPLCIIKYVREFQVQGVLYLHPPVGDNRLPSAVMDIFTIKKFEFNSC